MRLTPPDPDFRLTPAQRANVLPGYDVAALERLLGMVVPEARADLLDSFVDSKERRGWVYLVQLDDPELQAVLEEVWAPWWDRVPDGMMDEEPWSGYPGRELARKRRDARRSQSP